MKFWVTFITMLSAGVTYWGTNGALGLALFAGILAGLITAVFGPTLLAFFGED